MPKNFFNPGNSRKTRFNTHHFDADVAISFEAGLKCGCPPYSRACAEPPETTYLRERYFCGAAIQCQATTTSCLIAPPLYLTYYILLILSYLELKVDLEREIEREERKIYSVTRLHLVKKSISSKERAGGCRPPHPPLVKKSKVRLKLLT